MYTFSFLFARRLRIIVLAVLAGLGTVSCLGRIQDVYNVPPEYQGVWSDAEAGMEMKLKNAS